MQVLGRGDHNNLQEEEQKEKNVIMRIIEKDDE